MPNLDFYAVGEDHRAVLDVVFAMGCFEVFEAYSECGQRLRTFTTTAQVPLGESATHLLMLFAAGSGPGATIERYDVRPFPGAAMTWREQARGWGLVQLVLDSRLTLHGELRTCHTNHNTAARAARWADVYSTLGSLEAWDFTAVARHSRKLNRAIAALAVAKVGSHPVLPRAATQPQHVPGAFPHQPLVRPRGELDALGIGAVPSDRVPPGPVQADDLGQRVGIGCVRLRTGDRVPLPVPRSGPGVERVHGVPGRNQRGDPRAALGLDPDQHRQSRVGVGPRVRQVLRNRGVQPGHPGQPLRGLLLGQDLAVLVDQLDVVMVLSAVITYEQRTNLLDLAGNGSAAWRRTPSDLMAKVLRPSPTRHDIPAAVTALLTTGGRTVCRKTSRIRFGKC